MATLLEPAGLALSQTHLFVSDQGPSNVKSASILHLRGLCTGNHAVRVVDLISGLLGVAEICVL